MLSCRAVVHIVTLLTAGLPACGLPCEPGAPAQDLIQAGVQAQMRDDHEARLCFQHARNAIQRAGQENADAALSLHVSRQYREMGEATQALHHAKHALAQGGERPEALVAIGLATEMLGDLVHAAEAFEQALSHRPDHAAALVALSGALNSLGSYAAAADAAKKAVSIEADDADALFVHGLSHHNLKILPVAERGFIHIHAEVEGGWGARRSGATMPSRRELP